MLEITENIYFIKLSAPTKHVYLAYSYNSFMRLQILRKIKTILCA